MIKKNHTFLFKEKWLSTIVPFWWDMQMFVGYWDFSNSRFSVFRILQLSQYRTLMFTVNILFIAVRSIPYSQGQDYRFCIVTELNTSVFCETAKAFGTSCLGYNVSAFLLTRRRVCQPGPNRIPHGETGQQGKPTCVHTGKVLGRG